MHENYVHTSVEQIQQVGACYVKFRDGDISAAGEAPVTKKIQKFYSFAALESTVFYRYFCSLREESSIEFKASTDARLVWNDH